MATGGILFHGNGFVPDGESEEDDLSMLKFISPGSGSYSSQQEGNCVVMHFPESDQIDMTLPVLDESQVRKAYKDF